MKKAIIFSFCLFVFSLTSFAQTFAEDADALLNDFREQSIQNSFLNGQIQNNPDASSMSSVFIQQVGDANDITVNVSSANAELNLLQQGDENTMGLFVDANEVNQTVVQVGTNHNFSDYTSNGGIHNLDVIQTGNDQNLIFHGQNSISDDLQIKMDGANQTVIVRNFN